MTRSVLIAGPTRWAAKTASASLTVFRLDPVKGNLGTCFFITAALVCCGAVESTDRVHMQLTSTAFKEGEAIPARYTCDAKDLSPPLKWSGAPTETQRL